MSSPDRRRDQALVEAAVAREPGAFAALLRHCDVAIERCLSRLLARWPEAAGERADLRQGLELHLVRDDFRVLRSYRGEARLTTWIHAVTARHVYGALKRRRPAPEEPSALTAPAATPEQAVVRADRQARVRAVIDALPARDRALVGMMFEQELDAAQAARLLGLTPSGVRMRKKRLLASLAQKLAGLWP